jgi:hypothetical protein
MKLDQLTSASRAKSAWKTPYTIPSIKWPISTTKESRIIVSHINHILN